MQRRNFLIWTGMLGFALGGFFDGILLHQILQWHHLMSLVPGFGDLRTLVLWDGLFHVATYALAALGLWGMWRSRAAADRVGAKTVAGAWLLGFALWQAVDTVVFHWLLRIHRIRVDSDAPLLWDLGWLAVFGLIPGLLGWLLLKSAGDEGGGRAIPTAMALLVVAAGIGAAAPVAGQDGFTNIAFRPGLGPQQAMAALAAADARLVWADAGLGVVVADVPRGKRWSLYRHGALMVSGTGPQAGCLNASRARL